MEVFDDEWLAYILRLISDCAPANIWSLHRKVYELERKGVLPRHSWVWLGEYPRSPEVDAALGLLSLMGKVVVRGELVVPARGSTSL